MFASSRLQSRVFNRLVSTTKLFKSELRDAKYRESSFVKDSFLSGTSTTYIEEMHSKWQADPTSVHGSWDSYFRLGHFQPPPTLIPSPKGQSFLPPPTSSPSAPTSFAASVTRRLDPSHLPLSLEHSDDGISKIVKLTRAYQVTGFRAANLDPLGLKTRSTPAVLKLDSWGITQKDLDSVIDLSQSVSPIRGFLDQAHGRVKAGDIVRRLQETYTGTIGYEYMHITDMEKCNFIREHIETYEPFQYPKEEKIMILERLMWADHFESFLATKYASAKRFGLEGGESFIPGVKGIIHCAASLGVETIVMGMPHRGRLNVLSNVIRKPLEEILSGFNEQYKEKDGVKPSFGSGDVKYHLGMSLDRLAGPENKPIHLTLLANPSHLEAVDPVVCGKVRAKQVYKKDTNFDKVLGVIIHGDAAFSAQGVVYETMTFSQLPEFCTGGTIHVVVNNQVGFTADPLPGFYCTDIAKACDAPIFHVNADDPEAVTRVCEIATRYRMKFKTDVVVDLVCFRKHGHNEIDEPAFTQPLMYKAIRQHPPCLKIYSDKLVSEGVITREEIKAMSSKMTAALEESFEKAKTYVPKKEDWLETSWHGFMKPTSYSPPRDTSAQTDKLRDIGTKCSTVPSDFKIHKRLAGIFAKRLETVKQGKDIDWATGEALAFGTLLCEGYHVRLTGQDVERGTFSHRHAVVHDQDTNKLYTPLQHLAPGQALFTIKNSSLSEYAVLGFELGYSLESPNALVLWEAQFGDFVNGAQIIIDQFLSSGEDKWLRQSGLVLLLPHGYEGQGPEHSSARLERFLQLTNDNPWEIPAEEQSRQIQQTNWQVMNLTTPANYFHALRRQMYRQFRKPLILMTPKSLLRHPLAVSTLEDFSAGSRFKKVIGETDAAISGAGTKVRRLIFCSGKVYYDLFQYREKANIKDVAIARVEQIAPFPFHEVAREAKKYPEAEIVWVQEEPLNQGAWAYTSPRIETALSTQTKTVRPCYVGRPPAAATATGHSYVHKKEQEQVCMQAFAK